MAALLQEWRVNRAIWIFHAAREESTNETDAYGSGGFVDGLCRESAGSATTYAAHVGPSGAG
jgi:hypothetical protein